MQNFMIDYYMWIKAVHVIAVVSWMAGMLYLPRLFVYHADAEVGSDKSETFKVMEYRLLRFIMNPAMIVTIILGLLLIVSYPDIMKNGWMHVKMTAVLLMIAAHGMFSKWRKVFARDENKRPAKFYKIWNEVPTVLMIVIIVMIIVKPF